jgi:diguanylate cyclase (GGDEF)-like protein
MILIQRMLDITVEPLVLLNQQMQIIAINEAAERLFGRTSRHDEPFDALSLIHEQDRVIAEECFAEITSRCGSRTATTLRMYTGDRWKPVRLHLINLLDESGINAVAVSLTDIEREVVLSASLDQQRSLIETNRDLLTQLQRREQFLRRLLKTQASISHRAPLTSVLNAIVDGVADLLDASIVSLLIREPSDPTRLIVEAARGINDEITQRNRTQSVNIGLAGAAYRRGVPVMIDSYARFEDAHPDFLASGAQAAAAVPIRFAGDTIGVIIVGTTSPDRTFTALEIEMLEALSEHAAIALMDAQTLDVMADALNDSLTGLPNRQLLGDRLSSSLSRCRREGTCVAVLFVDIDRFRAINTGRGHAVGDRVLQVVAARLETIIRGHDTIARLGGDEFVAVIERTEPALANDIAQRLVAAIEEEIVIDEVSFNVTASIGISMDTDGLLSASQLVEQADIAMYRAKESSKLSIEFFQPDMQTEVSTRTSTERELRTAIKSGRIDVAYQPVGDLRTGGIYGVEALARWTSPTLGVMQPARFVQLAEQTGNVVALDRAVLRSALYGALELTDPVSGQPLMLNVNLSPQHLNNDDVIVDVAEALRTTGFPPRRLTLEITETDIMRDTVRGMQRLVMLKELGIKIALDDFGTGHSSMAYLRQFPVDTLKIDRSFISNVATKPLDPKASHLVSAMIDLGHALGMHVLAEGVEHLAELTALSRMGLDLVQGFWLGRPAPIEALPDLLEDAVRRLLTARSRTLN